VCESCNGAAHRGRRAWTTSHLVVVALAATLVALSILGLVLRGGEGVAATACDDFAGEAKAYETLVTRHLEAGANALIADTQRFLARTAQQGQSTCPELSAFATGVQPILQAVCPPCATQIRRSLDSES